MSRASPVTINPWTRLRALTPARIALGRAGAGLPTQEVLAFGLAHARARDAVHDELDVAALDAELEVAGYKTVLARSAASDRATYLRRPDLGRRLDEESAHRLVPVTRPCEIVVAIEDGLSALAVQNHAVRLLAELRLLAPQRWAGLTVVIALQGRVALGDEIGEKLGAQLVVVLIGERPGLSSPDSLGVYVTYAPRTGRTDAERNCISNVRPQGLDYAPAAAKLDWLVSEALRRKLTGTVLKDDSTRAAGALTGEDNFSKKANQPP